MDPKSVLDLARASNPYVRNVAGEANVGKTVLSPVEQDMNTLNQMELMTKYGRDEGSQLAIEGGLGWSGYSATRQDSRTDLQALSDTALGVGQGVVGGIGGIAAWGASNLPIGRAAPQLGEMISRGTNAATNLLSAGKSDLLQERQRYYATAKQLSSKDNAAKQQEEEAQGSGKVASSLRRIGRDALDSAALTLQDPALIGDVAAQAGGSLITGSAIGKGIGAISQFGKLGAATEGAVAAATKLSPTAGRVASAVAGKSPIINQMIGVGLQEGGGAYQQVVNQVMGMKHADLMKGSEEYRKLIEAGSSPEDAKLLIADTAANSAAMRTAPVAAALGRITAPFEAGGFLSRPGKLLGNVGKEILEETPQSAAGQLLQNIAVKKYADSSQDLLEGVGEQAAQGAIGAGVSAAAISAPSNVVRGAQNIVNKAADKVKGAIQTQLKKQETAAQEASPISVKNLAPQVDAALQAAPVAEEAFNQVQPTDEAHAQAVEQAKQIYTGLVTALTPDATKAQDETLPEPVRNAYGSATNVVSLGANLADVIVGDDPVASKAAAKELVSVLQKVGEASQHEMLSSLDQSDPIMKTLGGFAQLSAAFQQSPQIMSAVEQAMNVLENTQDANDPESVAQLAELDPYRVKPEVAEMVLKHETSTRFTDAQRTALNLAASLTQAEKTASENPNRVFASEGTQRVADEIRVTDESGSKGDSVRTHASKIFQAFRKGDMSTATAQLKALRNFTQGQINKANAITDHYTLGGERRSFDIYGKNGKATPSAVSAGVTPTSAKSVRFAQQVSAEANYMRDVYEALKSAMPILGGADLSPLNQFPEALNGEPKEIAQTHKQGATKPVKTASETPQPSPVKELKVEVKKPVQQEAKPVEEVPKAFERKSQDQLVGMSVEDLQTENKVARADYKRMRDAGAGKIELSKARSYISRIEGAIETKMKNPVAAEDIDTEMQAVVDAMDEKLTKQYAEESANQKKAKDTQLASIDSVGSMTEAEANKAMEDASLVSAYDSSRQAEADNLQGELMNRLEELANKPVEAVATPVAEAEEQVSERSDKTVEIVEKPAKKYSKEELKKATKEWFNKLWGNTPNSVGTNWFVEAFTFKNEPTTHIAGSETPMEDVIRGLNEVGSEITDAHAVLLAKVGSVLDSMTKSLNTFINDPKVKAALKEGKPIGNWVSAKALQFAEKNPNGGLQYNQQLLETMGLAVADWLANNPIKTPTSQALDEAEDFLLKSGVEPTQGDIYALAAGTTMARMAQDLSAKFQKYLGMDLDKDVQAGKAGVVSALAAEAIQAMLDSGMITQTTIKLGDNKSINALTGMSPADLGAVMAKPSLVEEAVMIEPERVFYFNDKKPPLPKKVMNQDVPLAEEQLKALKQANKADFKFIPHMIQFLQALGLDGVLDLYGQGSNLESRTMNVESRKRAEGKNLAYTGAYTTLMGMVQQASELGDYTEQVMHFGHNMSSVGRAQMLGNYTPQSNKLVREALNPNGQVLNLTDPNTLTLYKVALGQALGIKVHNQPHSVTVDQVNALVAKLRPAIGAFINFQKTGKLPDGFVNDLKVSMKNAGVDVNELSVHALSEIAQYSQATDKSNFTSHIYGEADGMTNGISNALFMWASAPFSPERIANMARAGFFFAKDMSANIFRGDKNNDTRDFYKVISESMMPAAKKRIANTDPKLRQAVVLIDNTSNFLIDKLLGGIQNSETISEYARSLVKNPATTILYGIGDKGIGSNLAKELITAIQDGVTDQSGIPSKDIQDALAILVGNTVTKKGIKRVGTAPIDWSNMNNFKLTGKQEANLAKTLGFAFGGLVRRATRQTLGDDVFSNLEKVMDATRIQSTFMAADFQKRVADRIAELSKTDPEFKAHHGLSPNEMTKIRKEVMDDWGGVIENGHQNISLSDSMRQDTDTDIARSFNGKTRVPMSVTGPVEISVKAMPALNIALGDGSMIQDTLMHPATKDALFVFDGVNFGVNDLQSGSLGLNKSANTVWSRNPLEQGVLASLNKFVERVNGMQQESVIGLLQTMYDGKRFDKKLEELSDALQSVEDLQTVSSQISANQQALQATVHSVDQMASFNAPYQSGSVEVTGTNTEIADKLNAMAGNTVDRVMSVTEAVDRLSGEVKGTQKNLIKALLQSPLLKGFAVLFQSATGNEKGSIDFSKKLIKVQDTAETLLHELVHAATFEKMLSHYKNGTSEIGSSIARLEGMLTQFRNLDIKDLGALTVWQDAMDTINEIEFSDADPAFKKAAALNEMMAWGLSNPDLAKELQKQNLPIHLRLAKSVVDASKALFAKLGFNVGDSNLYEAMHYEASVIATTEVTPATSGEKLYHKTADVNLERIGDLMDRLVASMPEGNNAQKLQTAKGIATGSLIGSKAVKTAAIFDMDAAEQSAFVKAATVLGGANPDLVSQAEPLYSEMLKQLTVEDFMDGTDPSNQSDMQRALDRYNAVSLRSSKKFSEILPTFVALGMTSSKFRQILGKVEMPSLKNEGTTFEDRLGYYGEKALRKFIGTMEGNAVTALDQKVMDLQESFKDEAPYITAINGIGDIASKGDALLTTGVSKAEKAMREAGQEGIANILGLVNETGLNKLVTSLAAQLDKMEGKEYLRDMLADVLGRTDVNKAVYDLIKGTRVQIQQFRQNFREHTPKILREAFTNPLNEQEQLVVRNTVLKTGASLLGFDKLNDYTKNRALLNGDIATREATIRTANPVHGSKIIEKAKQLAKYNSTGIAGKNLLRNGYAIGSLFGEATTQSVSPEMESTINELVAMYGLNSVDPTSWASFRGLMAEEAKGMRLSIALASVTAGSTINANEPNARSNAFFGHTPVEFKQGHQIIVADDARGGELLEQGYTRVGDYVPSPLDRSKTVRGYYMATTSTRAAVSQGIVQNVRSTYNGVYASTGFSTGPSAGIITDPVEVAWITRNLSRDNGSLMPVRDAQGEVYAYERVMDPAMIAKVPQNVDYAQTLGNVRGRQAEESTAGIVNNALVGALKAQYDQATDKSGYIDVFKSTDPVHKEMVKLMPQELKNQIKSAFGEEMGFPVQRTMVTQVLGYRNASVGDLWTGNSRMDPKVQAHVRAGLELIFGKNAYARAMQTERTVQDVVAAAKHVIVVKSVIVPMANAASNILQLARNGVPIAKAVQAIPRITREIEAYSSNMTRLNELSVLKAAAVHDQERVNYDRRIQAIRDANRRLSIWPLIEAGEFSTVSDATSVEQDKSLLTGKLGEYIDGLVDQLPESVVRAGKLAMIHEDTPLYKGLAKATQYGDFVAKAVMYQHEVSQGTEPSVAMGRVTEEFVNYEYLPGRFRGYLEQMGMIWFWNYKMRSIKPAVRSMVRNPFHALMGSVLPNPELGPINTGSPLSDNLVSKLFNGTLGYSVGPGMATQGVMLNPVVNALF